MPRESREVLEKILCHHMIQGINKENIFETKEYKNKYLSLLKKYHKKYKIDIISYCIMDNHVHMLLYSEKEEITLEQLSKDKEKIKKFLIFIKSKHYKFTKLELAKALKVSKATLYRRIDGTKI